jgi:hypothetical protein
MLNLEYFSSLVTIIGLPIGIVSLLIGLFNIKQSRKIEQGKFLIELRNMFPSHNEIHHKLRPNGEWSIGEIDDDNVVWAKIDSYLGLFELCEILIQKKVLSEKDFKSQYKYRLDNIWSNRQIRAKIKNESVLWTDLINLKKRFKE